MKDPKQAKVKGDRTYQCKSCRMVFQHTLGGRLPKICADCGGRNDADRFDMNARQDVLRRKTNALKPYKTSMENTQSMKAAIGLGIEPGDDVKACGYVGIQASPEEAKSICDDARLKWGDLIEGKATALGKLTDRAMMLMCIQMMESCHLIAPRELPQALRNTATFKELVIGEAKQTYGNISITIHDPVANRKELEIEEDKQ